MCPVKVYPVGRSHLCSVSTTGTIKCPQKVMARTGWTSGERVGVEYIERPLVLLFQRVCPDCDGFVLSPANRGKSGTSGGKLSCSRLANQVLRQRVALPLEGLPPLHLPNTPFQLALLLEPIAWEQVAFSHAGCDTLPPRSMGVYRVLSGSGRVLRIGEGQLLSRLREHLLNSALSRSARVFQWTGLPKDDAVLLERVLLSDHLREYGELPKFNKIHA